MPRIRQLDAATITRIAAGEVIERPASVLKELLENSLDAGATRIDIDLESGGIDLLRVVDNGGGIPADELALALAPHATSKLNSSDDLFKLRTLGFRGEALASIGGVAKVVLQSRPPDQAHGAEIQCDGSVCSAVRPWGGAVGTRIEVRHLFYSVPARKKFLKAIPTELGQCCEVVTRVALANPETHIVLRHNLKTVYELPATTQLTDRIGLFFGAEIRDALYRIDSGPTLPGLSGYVADPACDRGNAKLQYMFVNGRWFRDRSLSFALQDAYRGLLMTGRYPVGFLFLKVDPESVDINVHPTKAEVRFRESSVIFSLVRGIVKTRLLKESLIPNLEAPAPVFATLPIRPMPSAEPFSPRRALAEATPAAWEVTSRTIAPTIEAEPIAIESTPPPEPEPPTIPQTLFPIPTLLPGSVLQVQDTYLVAETPKGMLVIDQHALHERILYEQLRERVKSGKLEVQRLLIPEPIDLPADQAAMILEVKDALAELGLEISDFGGNTILLSSYPTLLSRRPPHEIFRGVVDELMTKDRVPAKEALFDHLLATMACKAAVKAGDRLSQEEITHLMQLRQLAEDSHHCPHGRPTSLLFSRTELDRQFRRI